MITTILVVYGLVLIFAIGYKLGNPFNEYSWLQVFFWPIVLLYVLCAVLLLFYRNKVVEIIRLIMFDWFNKNIKVNSYSINCVYNRCLSGDISFPKWRKRVLEKLAAQKDIVLNCKSDYKDDK